MQNSAAPSSSSAAGGASAASATNQRNQHMDIVTQLFEDDLVAAHEKDSSVEMLKQLTAALEIGAAVWGAPLLVDNRRTVVTNTAANVNSETRNRDNTSDAPKQ